MEPLVSLDLDLVVAVDQLEQVEELLNLLSILDDLPASISFVAKTPREIETHLTPLLLDICVDGISLYGDSYFDKYRQKALAAWQQAGLRRRRLGGAWMWVFPRMPTVNWDLNWEGFHERAR